jgi:hypothetical protein
MAHISIERKALSLKNLGQGGAAPLIASPYLAKTYVQSSKTYAKKYFSFSGFFCLTSR